MGQEIFTNIPSKVGEILTDVKNGKIGLPDLQRPFVWPDSKVRELLDSMMKGYPIGYIMLWSSPEGYGNASPIGTNGKSYTQPEDLVIDGQQRLTALLAALYGAKVKDKNYKERSIRISFNPLTKEFAVWSISYKNNSEWITQISDVFEADRDHAVSKYRKAFINECNEGRAKKGLELLTDDEENKIEESIKELLDLSIYALPTLKINAKASEEDVADIFVRVNSGGQNLTEKNFIETLLAVYDNDIHDRINAFCAESRIPQNGTAYNPILEVDPVHLIRAAVGLGFQRARLSFAYKLLRGKDLKTGEFSKQIQEENLAIFREALGRVLDLNNWHAAMNLFVEAGYRSSTLISSKNAVMFTYVLYLMGKHDFKVPALELNRIIKRWIFVSTITGFYTGSVESDAEAQYADLRDTHSADEFVQYLNRTIETRFTEDYFTHNLPDELNSSSSQSPAWFGYIAAFNVLGYPMLFSTTPLIHYFGPGASGTKNAIDKHHIFPKHYLEKIGITAERDRNQIANFTYLDYARNIDISDNPPSAYVARYREKLGEEGYALACKQNALPENFETMDYFEFLEKRRILMAEIIRLAFEKLSQ